MPIPPSFDCYLLVAGPIAAGKTWTSDLIAAAIPGASRSTFSRGLRKLAMDGGDIKLDRETMQRLGHDVVARDWLALWNATLEVASPRCGNALIIDGLRHARIVLELRRMHPGKIGLLTLEPAQEVLESRLIARGEDPLNGLHPVESELDQLQSLADVSLRGASAIVTNGAALVQLFSWLEGFSCTTSP